jgi:hypothetical protein
MPRRVKPVHPPDSESALPEILGRIADSRRDDSLAARFRRRRFQLFRSLLDSVPRPTRILDVGGTADFWEQMGLAGEAGIELVVLNIEAQHSALPNVRCVVGDARAMPEYEANGFDVVFSNSVIEHVGHWQDQQRMAREIARVGERYFVQTPNRYFPIEPHYLVPGFQFLPIGIRAELVRRVRLGHVSRIPDPEHARRYVTSIRLLTANQMRHLFPGSNLFRERVLGLSKSFVAHRGFPACGCPTNARDAPAE